MGFFVGQETKKNVGFGVAQKRCVQCEYNFLSKVGSVDHSQHPCKKNLHESSGAMETRILCKLQVAVTQGGARLKVCISDGVLNWETLSTPLRTMNSPMFKECLI